MKKLVCICVIMALVIGGGVAETILSARMFSGISAALGELNEEIIANESRVDAPELLEKADAILERWDKRKDLVMLFNNHNVSRSLDEKLASLRSYMSVNDFEDSRMLCDAAMRLADDLADETYPIMRNLF